MSEEVRGPPRPWLRLLVLFAGIAALYLVLRARYGDQMTPEGLRQLVLDSGGYGVVVFFVAFALGLLAQVPGTVFLVAALLTYGPLIGVPLTFAAGFTAITISFFVVRSVGGTALAGIDRPWIRKILAALDQHPIRTVAVLRLLFVMSPALNYALAMSSVRLRAYLLGSVLGLVPRVLFDTSVILFVKNKVSG